MPVLLENVNIKDAGAYEIKQAIDIRVTPEEARRKVNRWVLDDVSYMMHAESPTLVIDDRAVWRVPVALTASHVGRVGAVGEIDVDAITGDLLNAEIRKAKIEACAVELARTLPPYPGPFTPPPEYLVQDSRPARQLLIAEDDEVYVLDPIAS